jgi:hypothetical protein
MHSRFSNIDGKDRCDGLLKLADFRMARIVSRREHEWKVTVAFWALLAAGIAKPPTTIVREHSCIVIFLLSLIVVGHAIFWIYPHWLRSKEDVYHSFRYTDAAEGLLRIKVKHQHQKEPRWGDFPSDPKVWAQCATTLILAELVWFSSKGFF